MKEKKESPVEIETGKRIISVEDLAVLVGITPRRIYQLQHDGIIMPESGEHPTYDFLKTIIGLLRYYRAKADSRPTCPCPMNRN